MLNGVSNRSNEHKFTEYYISIAIAYLIINCILCQSQV